MPRRVAATLSSLGLVTVVLAGCTSSPSGSTSPSTDVNGRVQVYVAAKIMPVGMLVGTARSQGVLELRPLPPDVAGDDAVADTAGLECLVAAQSLPAGTVARRNQFVPPEDIGLNRGLTGGTGERPSGC